MGVTFGMGIGDGDLLGVDDDPDVGWARFAFGIVPEVEAVGKQGVVLGFDEAAADDDEGRAALAEVLALDALIAGEGVLSGTGRTVGG